MINSDGVTHILKIITQPVNTLWYKLGINYKTMRIKSTLFLRWFLHYGFDILYKGKIFPAPNKVPLQLRHTLHESFPFSIYRFHTVKPKISWLNPINFINLIYGIRHYIVTRYKSCILDIVKNSYNFWTFCLWSVNIIYIIS